MEEATFSAAVPLPDLPLNIWVEIFHKLPLVSVGRCLRVCKQWCCLISDPMFRSNYNPNSIRNHPISLLMECWCTLWRRPKGKWEMILLNEAFKHVTNIGTQCIAKSDSLERRPCLPRDDLFTEGRGITLLGSCNGLVGLHKNPAFLLFNPWTKDEKLVHLDCDQAQDIDGFCCLYGLCYDPARDEYKAVMCDFESFCVVSFKDGSLKPKAQSQVLQNVIVPSGLGVRSTMVRGIPHWVSELHSGGDVIIYFDLLTEEPQMVRFPKQRTSRVYGHLTELKLGALDGELTAAIDLGQGLGYEVWALKEYGNEPAWSKLFVIPKACDSFEILARVSDDEILVFRQFLKVYNIRNQSCRELLLSNGLHKVLNYIPSLVSPNQ